MAHLLQKHYGSWRHELKPKDLIKYTAIAIIALLGIAGLLQSIAGISQPHQRATTSKYGSSVYAK